MEFIYVKTNTTQYMSYVSYFRLSPSCPIYHFRQKLCLSQVLQQNEKRYRNIQFPIHLWRYKPFWALTSFKRHLHSSLSSARLLHSRIPKICDVSLRTTSFHLVLGFPTGLLLWNFPFRFFLGDPFIVCAIILKQLINPWKTLKCPNTVWWR